MFTLHRPSSSSWVCSSSAHCARPPSPASLCNQQTSALSLSELPLPLRRSLRPLPMPLFKNKIRSAHGMFSQKRASDASRSSASTTSSAQKGSSSELAPAYVDSVMAPDADADAQAQADGSGGAINEPLVLDFPTMFDGADPNTNGAPLSPVISLVDLERRTSWLSDDDDCAPAPQIEFARREIHIPSRTRYAPLCSFPSFLLSPPLCPLSPRAPARALRVPAWLTTK